MIISGYKMAPIDRYYGILYARRTKRWLKISHISHGDEGFPKRWFEQNHVDSKPSTTWDAAPIYLTRRKGNVYSYKVVKGRVTAVRTGRQR